MRAGGGESADLILPASRPLQHAPTDPKQRTKALVSGPYTRQHHSSKQADYPHPFHTSYRAQASTRTQVKPFACMHGLHNRLTGRRQQRAIQRTQRSSSKQAHRSPLHASTAQAAAPGKNVLFSFYKQMHTSVQTAGHPHGKKKFQQHMQGTSQKNYGSSLLPKASVGPTRSITSITLLNGRETVP